jgi:hypothetical protein
MPRGRPRKETTEEPKAKKGSKAKAAGKGVNKDGLKHQWELRLKQLGIK